MKKLLSILSLMVLSVMLYAQTPQSFSYQTVIRDASWSVLANQSVGIEISILEDATNGAVMYKEEHSSTTSQIGLVNLAVGEGTVVSGDFTTIDWGNHSYFIQVAVDVTGGSNYQVMGTTQLRSVPYALYAETSGNPGPQGIPGDTGAVGPQGPIGLTGATGTFANGITVGEILFWNGINWLALNPPDTNNMFLTYNTTTNTPEWDNVNQVAVSQVAAIGDYRDGGVVFWVDSNDNRHGLVCAINDVQTWPNDGEWGCIGTNISGADGTSIGTGQQNTSDIINANCSPQTPGYSIAANLVGNFNLNGYYHWFLPSKDELNQMYANKAAINATAIANGGSAFVAQRYWTSTEYNDDYAWSQHFANGTQVSFWKYFVYYVRPIRAF